MHQQQSLFRSISPASFARPQNRRSDHRPRVWPWLAVSLGVLAFSCLWIYRASAASGAAVEWPAEALPLKVRVEAEAWAPAVSRAIETWNQVAGRRVLETSESSDAQIVVSAGITDPTTYKLTVLGSIADKKIRVLVPVSSAEKARSAMRFLGMSLGLRGDREPTSVMSEGVAVGLPWRILPRDQATLRVRYGQN